MTHQELKKINDDIVTTLREDVPSYSMAMRWPAELKKAGNIQEMTVVKESLPLSNRKPLTKFMT